MNHQPLSLICEELLLDSVEQCLFCCRASYVQKAWFDHFWAKYYSDFGWHNLFNWLIGFDKDKFRIVGVKRWKTK